MRLAPRSISGQLLVVWLLAMLATHGIAVLVMSWWHVDHSVVDPMSARMIETRIAAAYRLVDATGDDQLLDRIGLPDSSFRIQATAADPQPMDATEQQLATDLREMLALPVEQAVHVRLRQVPLVTGSGPDRHGWLERLFVDEPAWRLHADIGLTDGRVLSSDHKPAAAPIDLGRLLGFSMLVGMIPTTFIAIFFGRRIMRPFKVLTRAAHRVSRGEQVVVPLVGGTNSVREITQAFNDMQHNLARFASWRTTMFAAISHDLRTPLTSLRIRAELVDDEALRGPMIKTLDDMRAMVEEILNLAKDDVLEESLSNTPVNAFLQAIQAEHTVLGHAVTFSSDLPEHYSYLCRPIHLKRALNNLLGNAVRYGAVAMRAHLDEVRGKIVIEVLDRGPGIPAEQLEQVFEPFVRLDAARSQTEGGFGLGLTIARSCVRAHGGSLVLENRQGGGLRAIVQLPV